MRILNRREYLVLTGGGIFVMKHGLAAPEAMAWVDHLILGVSDLEAGRRFVQEQTGVTPSIGGRHPGRGTRNALLSFGRDVYLEVLAPDPEQDTIDPRYAFLKTQNAPRMIGWAAGTRQLEKAVQRLQESGLETAGPFAGSRDRPDGGRLAWRIAAVTSVSDPLVPFLIEWAEGSVHPAQDSPGGCRLVSVAVETPEPKGVERVLEALQLKIPVRQSAQGRLLARLETPLGNVELS